MSELFYVYTIIADRNGKMYLNIGDDGWLHWDERDKATPMERALAALWTSHLDIKEPLSSFGIEFV